jgi:tetratricopeptide (TPR) repeat protein
MELLPEPKFDWEASTWLLAAIGDANFLGGHYEQAREALSDAMHCPDAIGNPFIHLRLGQAQFELGNLERAADELARAYMAAGKDIFSEDDPKYFAFLKTVLKPPVGGEW